MDYDIEINKDANVTANLSLKIEYMQDADSCDDNQDDVQVLTIENDNAGGGDFFVINTVRWAVDKLSDLDLMLNDYKEKYSRITKNKK